MKTTVTETSGMPTIIRSWDAAGSSATIPKVDAGIADVNGNGDDGIDPLFIILPIVMGVIILVGVGVLLFFLVFKKKEEEETEPLPVPIQPEQTVEQMVFGEQEQQLTQEQLYGTRPGMLPPSEIQQQVQGGQITPAQTAAPPPQVEQPPAPVTEGAPAPAPAQQAPQVTLPEQQ
jgi:hypothetical protein